MKCPVHCQRRLLREVWIFTIAVVASLCTILSVEYAQFFQAYHRSPVQVVHIPNSKETDEVAGLQRQILVEKPNRVEIPYIENLSNEKPNTRQEQIVQTSPCLKNKQNPFLKKFTTYPPIKISPVFNEKILEYTATVSYDTYFIRIEAEAESCDNNVILHEGFGTPRPTSFLLGLGTNTLYIFVRNKSNKVLNTYTFKIRRRLATEFITSIQPSLSAEVCKLFQLCDLQFIPNMPCDLQNTKHRNWVEAVTVTERLPPCSSANNTGFWLVPCSSCSNYTSCHWNKALWRQEKCQYPKLSRQKTNKCFAGKKVLFVGDSTNRGIMHYIIERINDTLTEWEKTHHIKVYSDLNNGLTTTSFAYYPQFWIKQSRRPDVETTLVKLIKITGPLENNTNTVIVLGGVQWLTVQQLKGVQAVLRRAGLSGAKLVMKSIGAGFHKRKSKEDVVSFYSINKELLTFGASIGYHVVDTYQMTMARFKDFWLGRCACHFHEIEKISTAQDSFSRYHVKGQINKIYSEIVINNICSDI